MIWATVAVDQVAEFLIFDVVAWKIWNERIEVEPKGQVLRRTIVLGQNLSRGFHTPPRLVSASLAGVKVHLGYHDMISDVDHQVVTKPAVAFVDFEMTAPVVACMDFEEIVVEEIVVGQKVDESGRHPSDHSTGTLLHLASFEDRLVKERVAVVHCKHTRSRPDCILVPARSNPLPAVVDTADRIVEAPYNLFCLDLCQVMDSFRPFLRHTVATRVEVMTLEVCLAVARPNHSSSSSSWRSAFCSHRA